ncbi:MAG: calcium-binding protein [Neptuniibacter caesariensis]|uniref:Calcium-binding protein n=1 Tax=Neptuniibacter caesariensis TaxID=207954 RepID=A0A2G6JNW1_NEPCE|nr:MAG: calcium-binding protein [Neptuniibacter caesariensis]
MTLKSTAIASLLVFSSTMTLAATQPEVIKKEEMKAPSIFEQLDQNKDGKVSIEEAQVSPALVKSFDKIDSNRDGYLSKDEFSQLQVKATTKTTFFALAAM